MKKAAALIRVSTDKQELESQKYDLRVIAQKLGYEIPDELIFGQKITGYDGGFVKDKKTGEIQRVEDRDSIIELKNACAADKENKIKCIFIWELSRLSRKPSTLLTHIEYFNTAGKPIYFTSHNIWTIDVATGEVNDNSTIQINMLATFGEQERKKILERHNRGKRYAVNENRYLGGLVPYGYDIEVIKDKKYYIIHPERSKIVIDIYDKYLNDGWASDKIARYLNLNKIPTYYNFTEPDKKLKTNIGRFIERKDIKWTHTSVLQILRNPFYKGERKFKDLIVSCPVIIEPEMWEQVQEKVKDNNKFGAKKRKFNYPVKELLRCGECGSKFYGAVTSSKQLYYCNRFQLEGVKCNCNKINKYRLDGVIWSFISNTPYIYEYFKYLYSIDNDSDIIKELHKQNELENKEIIELTARKKTILSKYGKGIFSDDELDKEAIEINNEIQQYQSSIKKRNSKINLLSKQQKSKLTPEQIKIDIENAGDDIEAITLIIKSIIERITITNIIDERFSLITVSFKFGEDNKDVNSTVNLIFDHTLKTDNKFYYLGSQMFDKETRKFKMIKPIIPDTVNMQDVGTSLEIAGSIEALKVENQTYKNELIKNLKDKYGITFDYELVDIYDIINSGVAESYSYNLIETNPFTMDNPEYAAYIKKAKERKNELKRINRKKKKKDYVPTPEEVLKRKITNIHTKRWKIRNMDISEEEKNILLNETRIEIEKLREEQKLIEAAL